MMYRITYHLIEIPSITYLIPSRSGTRGHNIRYLQPSTRVLAYQYSFFPSTIRLWNNLPQTLVSSGSIDIFRHSQPSIISTSLFLIVHFWKVLVLIVNGRLLTWPHVYSFQCDNTLERGMHLLKEEDPMVNLVEFRMHPMSRCVCFNFFFTLDMWHGKQREKMNKWC
jgi:hypothetical protein